MFGRSKASALKASGQAAGAKAVGKARRGAPADLPNPIANVVLADLALRGGGALLRRAVEKGLLAPKLGKQGASQRIKSRSMAETLVSAALTRVASRSVPGAIVVGGGMVAKALYDRRKSKAKAKKGQPADD